MEKHYSLKSDDVALVEHIISWWSREMEERVTFGRLECISRDVYVQPHSRSTAKKAKIDAGQRMPILFKAGHAHCPEAKFSVPAGQ